MKKRSKKLPSAYLEDLPALSPDQIKAYILLANKSFNQLINSTDPSNSSWTPMKTSHLGSGCGGMKLCIETSGLSSSWGGSSFSLDESAHEGNYKIPVMCGFTQCTAALEELPQFFKSDTTESFKKNAEVFGQDFLDCKVLYTLKTGKDSITIKWLAFHSPLKLIIADRDAVYVEKHGEFIDHNGQKGWAKSLTSIELPTPLNLKKFKFVRSYFYNCGYVFRESCSRVNALSVAHKVDYDPQGKLPRWTIVKGTVARLHALASLDRQFVRARLDKQTYLAKAELLSKKEMKECRVCLKSFAYFFFQFRKHNCQKCGEVVCTKCCQKWVVCSDNCRSRKKHFVKLCTHCLIHIRNAHRHESIANTSSLLSNSEEIDM